MLLASRRLLPTLALLATVLVSAMDVTVIATVMPTIVGELGGLGLYSWSFSAYLLTATTTLPIYGKLADTYGRKPLFLSAMALFLLGSLLCGLAGSMEVLIACRAVQGLGAGGLLTITITLAGDLFPLDERPKIQGAISAVWGIAAIVGPAVGSAIVSQTSWRWVFWLNLPIGGLATAILATSFHERVTVCRQQVDYAGAVLLTAGVGALLGALVGGGQAGFTSPPVLGLLGAAVALLALLARVEVRAAEPVVPLRLLRDRLQALASVAALALGACIYSASTYLPLLVQGVQGGRPYDVALVTGTVSVAWTAGSVFAGRTLPRLGYRGAAGLGMGLLVLGGVALLRLALDTPLAVVVSVSAVVGSGLGLASTPLIVLVQNTVGWDERGVATAAQQFFRSIGGMSWVSVQGAVLSTSVAAALAAAPVAPWSPTAGGTHRLGELSALLDPAARATLPAETLDLLVRALAAGLHAVFVLFLIAALAGLLAVALLPAVPQPAPKGLPARPAPQDASDGARS